MNKSCPRSCLFLERLNEEVLIGDGAMGTLLYSRGIPLEVNFEYLNLVNPSVVKQVHIDYAKAGAHLLETNTFGANALRLSAIGLEKKVREINEAGARLARSAAGPQRFVAGSVGPLIPARGEASELSLAQKKEVLREQMEALAEGGIDLFILETFSALDDLELALAVAGDLGLPAAAQMAFLEQGRSREGVRRGGGQSSDRRRSHGAGSQLRFGTPRPAQSSYPHGRRFFPSPIGLSQFWFSPVCGRTLHLFGNPGIFCQHGQRDGYGRRLSGGRLLRHHP